MQQQHLGLHLRSSLPLFPQLLLHKTPERYLGCYLSGSAAKLKRSLQLTSVKKDAKPPLTRSPRRMDFKTPTRTSSRGSARRMARATLRSRPRARKATSRSRTPRATSRSHTPRATSRSRTPRATSRSPALRASRSPTPRASRSPAPRASSAAAASSKAPTKFTRSTCASARFR